MTDRTAIDQDGAQGTREEQRPAESVVVTGAAGWLGRNLVAELAPARAQVRALVQHEDESALVALAGRSVEPVVGDIRDPVALDRLFDGAPEGTTVVHSAAVIHPESRTRQLFDVNVGGTALVLDRAQRRGAGRVVHVSSNSPFGVNPDPDHRFDEASPYDPYLAYGQSKQEAEELVLAAARRGDVDAVIVRPPWFYGPHQPERQTTWLRAVRRGRFPLVGDGSNRRSMVYAGNLVHGILRAEAAGRPGAAYWIADPEPYAMVDVLATVRRALELEGLPVSGGQPRVPRAVGVVAERVDRALQRVGRYVQPVHVLGELKETIACDVGHARRELGYDPPTTLLDGMRASIRWCLERGQAL
jgi:nucleoside-diphosphate-sugar epimerase